MTLNQTVTWENINYHTFGTTSYKTHQLCSLNKPSLASPQSPYMDHPSTPTLTNPSGWAHIFLLGRLWGCLQYTSNPTIHLPSSHTPLLPSFQWCQLGKKVYLCSLTLSLRPDEAASACKQQKLVLNNMIIINLFQHTEVNLTWIQTKLVTYLETNYLMLM